MQDKINKLKIELAELIEWKKSMDRQQVQYPIDMRSEKIVREKFLVATGEYGTTLLSDLWIEVKIGSRIYWLSAKEN